MLLKSCTKESIVQSEVGVTEGWTCAIKPTWLLFLTGLEWKIILSLTLEMFFSWNKNADGGRQFDLDSREIPCFSFSINIDYK